MIGNITQKDHFYPDPVRLLSPDKFQYPLT